jgi:uncharacterized protein (PEP-CTERM system associated)
MFLRITKIKRAMGKASNTKAMASTALLAAALSNGAGASDWKLDAGVVGRETFTDNVRLAATNAESDFITEVRPYVSASKKGARFEADFRYAMSSYFYANDSSSNGLSHNLMALAKAELYENELFLDADASIYQQFTSLLGAVGTDPATSRENLTDIYTASISPYWRHRFGSFSNLLARYRHAEFRNNNDALDDSSIDAVNVTLGSGTQFQDLSWSLNYSDQQTDYEDRRDVSFSSAAASLGYALTSKLQINGSVGYQDNSYLAGASELTGTFWTAGLAWAPNTRTSINLGYDYYPYGDAPRLALAYRARYWTVNASYALRLTTTSTEATIQRPIFLGTAVLPDGQLFNIFALDPTRITTNQVYSNERFQLGATYAKGKTTLGVTLYHSVIENREVGFASGTLTANAFQFGDTIKEQGLGILGSWRLTPVLTSTFRFDYADISYPDLSPSRDDKLYHISVGLARTFNSQLSGRLEVRHQQRDSNVAGGEYDENAIIGTVTYQF